MPKKYIFTSAIYRQNFGRYTLLLLLSSIFFTFPAKAQNLSNKVIIKWEENRNISNPKTGKSITYPYSTDVTYQEGRNLIPIFIYSQKISSNQAEFRILNPVYSKLEGVDEILNADTLLSQNLFSKGSVEFEKKSPHFQLILVPIRKTSSGTYEKLESFDLQIIPIQSSQRSSGIRSYAANSVLSTGKWVKIGVTENGVYQLTYDFLKSLGVDVDNMNPTNFRLYGNGGGMLPQANSTPIYDDLAENAVKMMDGGDGKFNQGDRVIFFGKGPSQWNYSSNKYNHTRNPYSDTSYYFINSDIGTGKRIQDRISLASTPDVILNSFEDYQIHEVDKFTDITEAVKSGREWYGEDFEFDKEHTFDFNFPNIITSEKLRIVADIAGRSFGSSLFTQLKLNNSIIGNISTNATGDSYENPFGSKTTYSGLSSTNTANNKITLSHQKTNSEFNVWINYVTVIGTRELKMTGDQMKFRNMTGFGKIVQYSLDGQDNLEIWDVSDPINVKKQLRDNNGSRINFIFQSGDSHELVAFNNIGYLNPVGFGSVANQNLHNIGSTTMVIVAPNEYLQEAERLARHRRDLNGYTVQIVNQEQLFNEFSSGSRDAGAIRNFMKMLYDRAGTDKSKLPRFLLLFGDGSYDNKNRIQNNNNKVMTYQSYESLSRTNSYVSDDYFGLLDDNEGEMAENGISVGRLDIGIGRFCVNSLNQAKDAVDKILEYESIEATGDWRNKIAFAADNGDSNIHLIGAEDRVRTILARSKLLNIDKMYMDAFTKQSTPGGDRYPSMTESINQKINNGVLIFNYIGHGGESRLAAETVVGVSDVNSWSTSKRYPIFFTATCSFTRWDDPNQVSAGEQSWLNRKGGAISMFTTTRIVYIDGNDRLNDNFYKSMLDSTFDKRRPTMGELVAMAKNLSGITVNDRNFTLLGDPALEVAIAQNSVVATTLNNKILTPTSDTLKALGKYTFKGIITDRNGNKLTNFNGQINPTVYDQISKITTLAQESGSKKTTFDLYKNIIYKGAASVVNGDYSFTFIVPKDISSSPAKGRLSFYAADKLMDAGGFYDSISVGGTASAKDIIVDNIGPDVRIFLNDKKFVSGGMTNNNPKLLVSLSDSSGINTVGSSIGHDLTATISKDGGKDRVISLNSFYAAKLDSYQQGEVNYPFANLEPGNYTLKVKAWDVFNNSNETSTNFFVSDGSKLSLNRIYNYPNPFTTSTAFQFEHNRTGDELDIMVKIFTVSGKLINTLSRKILASGNRVDNIMWDGKDEFGDKLARGVYIYQLKVRSSDGSIADKFEKLVIL